MKASRFQTVLALACLCLLGCSVRLQAQGSSAPAPPPSAQAAKPLILLYDALPARMEESKANALGAQRWLQVNQDAKSYQTGVVDISALMIDIGTRTNFEPPPWAMLDLEEPFFDNLLKAKDSEERKRSVASMIAMIKAAKARYPNTKWTFYGIPNVPYWVAGSGWASASPEARKAMLERAESACQELVTECDWVSVSIYDYYDPALLVPGSPNSIRGTPETLKADGDAWRAAAVGLAKKMAQGKPVIPMVFPYWAPGGIAPACRLLSPRRFIESQVAPAIAARADGIAIWTGITYRIDQVIDGGKDPGFVTREKKFGIAEWRAAFVADYLGNHVPANWDSPQVRQTLVSKTTETIIQALKNIRNYESTKALP